MNRTLKKIAYYVNKIYRSCSTIFWFYSRSGDDAQKNYVCKRLSLSAWVTVYNCQKHGKHNFIPRFWLYLRLQANYYFQFCLHSMFTTHIMDSLCTTGQWCAFYYNCNRLQFDDIWASSTHPAKSVKCAAIHLMFKNDKTQQIANLRCVFCQNCIVNDVSAFVWNTLPLLFFFGQKVQLNQRFSTGDPQTIVVRGPLLGGPRERLC